MLNGYAHTAFGYSFVGHAQAGGHINPFRTILKEDILKRTNLDAFSKNSAFRRINESRFRMLPNLLHKKIAIRDEILSGKHLMIPYVHRALRRPMLSHVESLAMEDRVSRVISSPGIRTILTDKDDGIGSHLTSKIECSRR